jgi:hypothetical protein
MKISHHLVKKEFLTTLYLEDCGRLDSFLTAARQHPNGLNLLASVARSVYRAGSVVAPDAPEVARALLIAAQAKTAIFVAARVEEPPRYVTLGEGPPITYSSPIDEAYVHVGTWTDAFYLAAITRQSDLLAVLRGVPTDLLRQSSTRGSDFAYQYVDFLKDAWATAQFTHYAEFIDLEKRCAACTDRTARCKYVRHLTAPFLSVLRCVEAGDSASLNSALAEASKMHKKYWNASEKLRNDFDGFVSLQLTAAAALAWDRGMRFDVESDYTPRSWVTGELFTTATK